MLFNSLLVAPTLVDAAPPECGATHCASCLEVTGLKEKSTCAWCPSAGRCGARQDNGGRVSMPGCEGAPIFRGVDECALVDEVYREARSDAFLEPRLEGWEPLGKSMRRSHESSGKVNFPPVKKGHCYKVVLRARSPELLDHNKFRAVVGLETKRESVTNSPEMMSRVPSVLLWDLGCPQAPGTIELKQAPAIPGEYELQVYTRLASKADQQLAKAKVAEREQLRLGPTCDRCLANRRRCSGSEPECLRGFIACVRANGHEPASCFIDR
ncbi:MAG: hypothetical protein IPG45_37355 [Deltaproteobacteria bacterium]|nr:hypothetical protein [Deltaproteobacteria bacterium]